VLALARRFGLGQLLADGVKMLGKEDMVPADADGIVFRAAPYLAMIGAFLPFCVVPFGHHLVMLETPVGALFAIAASGITVLALKMAGWGSGSKWSLLGGMRAVAQLISYEIPVGLAVAGVVLWSGTLDLHAIVGQQYRDGVLTVLGWNALQSPFLLLLAAILFFAGLAECQRTRSTCPRPRANLSAASTPSTRACAGACSRWRSTPRCCWSRRWSRRCSSAATRARSASSGSSPCRSGCRAPLHAVLLLLKMLTGFGLMMWIRWTLPRFRVDQVMRLCWLSLVPLCLLALFALRCSCCAPAAPRSASPTAGCPRACSPTSASRPPGRPGSRRCWSAPSSCAPRAAATARSTRRCAS
jgi:NADH-quinone oxidoreductase subunit H